MQAVLFRWVSLHPNTGGSVASIAVLPRAWQQTARVGSMEPLPLTARGTLTAGAQQQCCIKDTPRKGSVLGHALSTKQHILVPLARLQAPPLPGFGSAQTTSCAQGCGTPQSARAPALWVPLCLQVSALTRGQHGTWLLYCCGHWVHLFPWQDGGCSISCHLVIRIRKLLAEVDVVVA